MAYRVGTGFDSHAFASGAEAATRPLVLGGVVLSETGGLEGHSDADVVAHALADAVLGAAGLGSLGEWFPDTDDTLRGADSVELLARVRQAVERAGWRVANADCSVVLDAPKLSPHRRAMEERLAAALDGPVSVKPKRAEGLGSSGLCEGVVCFASVLLVQDGRSAGGDPGGVADPSGDAGTGGDEGGDEGGDAGTGGDVGGRADPAG